MKTRVCNTCGEYPIPASYAFLAAIEFNKLPIFNTAQ